MATVKQLRDAFNAPPASQDDAEVEVWLPGSYIRLEPKPFFNNRHRKYLIEGNLQPGSALER